MTAIAKELSMSINGLGSVTDAKSAATALSKVQDDLRGAVKQLKAISPPADVKAPHEALTQAASDFADQLDPIIVKLNNGDLSALSAVTTLKAFKALQVANDKITKLGYKINA